MLKGDIEHRDENGCFYANLSPVLQRWGARKMENPLILKYNYEISLPSNFFHLK